MVKLAYGAGHGISTPGKRTPNGEREWTFNNAVVVAFENELKKYENIELKRLDDPTGKIDIDLPTRTNNANKWGADYYISFHHNAVGNIWLNKEIGVETYIHIGNQPKSLALAKAIHPALVKGYGLKDRGIKQKSLHIVRETKMPAILIEGGFMDSLVDIKVMRDSAKMKNIGILIAQAFAKFAGLKLKSTPTPQPTQPKPNQTPAPTPAQPSNKLLNVTKIAREVYAGRWGNGEARKVALTKAGYNATVVQAEVTRLVNKQKTSEQVAKEVWQGLWGNGDVRRQKLKQHGYDYDAVHVIVEELRPKKK